MHNQVLLENPSPGRQNRSRTMQGQHQLSRDDTYFNATSNSNQKDPFLNHVLKQINSLKVENLELKKMINDKVVDCNRAKSQRSGRKVSISIEKDLEPIKSLRSLKSIDKSTRTPRQQIKTGHFNNNSMRAKPKSLTKPLSKSVNRSSVSRISRGSK